MVEQRDGWFVRNLKDSVWRTQPEFCAFAKMEGDERFPEVGINLFVLYPGKPNCRYHRENAQEDFLVLSGCCTLLVNEQEHPLGPWDFVHCPAGTSHVFIGSGTGPSAVLAIGRRLNEQHAHFYPRSELARRFGAEVREATADPRQAYADVSAPTPLKAFVWPPASDGH